MPKFMTYQRPTPVNKANWTGSNARNPHQPVRGPSRVAKAQDAAKPALPARPPGFKPN